MNDDALAVVSPGFLVEHQCRVVIGDGYGLPLEEPKCFAIVPVDPAVIVFSRAVFLAGDRVKGLIQIDIERAAGFAAYGDRRQDARGVASSRIGHVEHVQDRTVAFERDNAAAARVETDTLLFIADLQQELLAELSLFQRGER